MNINTKILDSRIKSIEQSWPGDVSIDLMASRIDAMEITHEVVLTPGQMITIGAGIAIHLDNESIAGMILPKYTISKRGIRIMNTVGVVDPWYDGELLIHLENVGNDYARIQPLERIAHLMIIPVIPSKFVVNGD